MAWSTSKMFIAGITTCMNNAAAFDCDADTFKNALYGNTITPDATVSAANSAYNAAQWVTGGEVTDTNWAAGGRTLGSVTSSASSNVWTFDAADTASGGSVTLTAYGSLIYNSTTSSYGLCFNYFGGAASASAGTFTVIYNASGIASITA
jgi:hypothetical protein